MSIARIIKAQNRDMQPFLSMLFRRWPKEKHRWLGAMERGDIRELIASPKVDGVRCSGTINALFTRNGKEIQSLRHIVDDVNLILRRKYKRFRSDAIVLDGELYGEDRGKPLGEILGNVTKRQDRIDFRKYIRENKVSLYLFDVFFKERPQMPYVERFRHLQQIYQNSCSKDNITNIIMLPVRRITSDMENEAYFDECVSVGYEGTVIRTAHGIYTPGDRNAHVMKYLYSHEECCRVVKVHEGSGLMQGMVSCVDCLTSAGISYRANFNMSHDRRAFWWQNRTKLHGSLVSVRSFAQQGQKMRFASVHAVLNDPGSPML